MPDKTINKIIKNCDLDGDSMLNYHEFITAAYNHKSLLSPGNIEKIFSLLDKDGDGLID